MDKVRIGVIGIGNMGAQHSKNLLEGNIPNASLGAVCDWDEGKLSEFSKEHPEIKVFASHKELISSGTVDAVLISTYHYTHPNIAIDAFSAGLHVLTEKPAGVYTSQVQEMNDAAEKSGLIFGIMYNQRTNPAYQKVRQLVQTGELGDIKRANWIVTTWYRPQCYHDSSSWRSTWKDEGGGVLINQCPHNLDLWQWILGMPKSIQANMGFGKHYDIEVEDEVTAYMEYENGAVGTFITSTAEVPGTNCLEIAGTRGKVVVEGTDITFWRLAEDERDFNKRNRSGFAKPEIWECKIPIDSKETGHCGILEDFCRSILSGTPLLSPGKEGILGLTISNAMHMSAWTDERVTLPIDSERFKALLDEKIKNSTYVKKTKKAEFEMGGSYK